MAMTTTTGELDRRFSSEDADPTPWPEVQTLLERAETYWLTTVRDDGRPHATTLVGVWSHDAFWFCTGASEQKAKNLERQHDVLVTAGCSGFEGVDVVVEGSAQRVGDEARLAPVAAAFRAKYEPPFDFDVDHGMFIGKDGNHALVFEVTPSKILAFEKGDEFAQTRWLRDG